MREQMAVASAYIKAELQKEPVAVTSTVIPSDVTTGKSVTGKTVTLPNWNRTALPGPFDATPYARDSRGRLIHFGGLSEAQVSVYSSCPSHAASLCCLLKNSVSKWCHLLSSSCYLAATNRFVCQVVRQYVYVYSYVCMYVCVCLSSLLAYVVSEAVVSLHIGVLCVFHTVLCFTFVATRSM
jgi:hypothetical protein